MSILLGNVSLAPLLYGSMIFLLLIIGAWKLTRGHWVSLVLDVAVFAVVFQLFGGTAQGAFAATVAALLSSIFLGLMFHSS